MDEPRKQRLLTRPDVLAWAMYDWANSAFSTLSITIIVVYFSEVLFPKTAYDTFSGSAYAYTLAAATLVAGLLSPIVGALADARASKAVWLRVTALGGAGCCLGMGLCPAEPPWLATLLFIGAVFFFELSYGFANAFLPELSDDRTVNKVSAFGFALGYVGGALALIVGLQLYDYYDRPELSLGEKLRPCLLVIGSWWGIFSLPAIILLKDRAVPRSPEMGVLAAARLATREVGTTLRNIRQYKMLALFLVGFLLYNDCVQTVISQSSNFAKEDLQFTTKELIQVILMIQFVALPGSLLMGWLSDRLGQRPVLFLCLGTWMAILLAAWFITSKTHFWIMGVAVALVMGGIQSVSRAIMGTMTPKNRTAEFFGFYNLSSKATCFIGPVVFGAVYQYTGKYKLAILSLLVQLVIGAVLVSRVDIKQGEELAEAVPEPISS
jgi:MFS transporter, UMF1 family